LSVGRTCPLIDQVIRVNDETDQPMLCSYQIDLLFPEVNVVAPEDIKEPVILGGGGGKFNEVPYEVRHDRAATTSLRVQMSGVRYRHIVGGFESVIPLLVAIHDGGSKSVCAVLFQISIYFGGSPEKFFLSLE